jgi:hypothetical protein
MMATTHGLAGLLVGAVFALLAPGETTLLLAAGFAGGLAPDLDLYWGHRKTLHFPVYGAVAALAAVAFTLASPSVATLSLAAFLTAAAVHAASDVLGGGLELRPWEAGSEHAVYSHYHGRWLEPRRLVPYDGSPHDLTLVLTLGVPALAITTGPLQIVVASVLVVSAAYTLLRKRLASLATVLAGLLPERVVPYVPERYRSGGNSRATSSSRRT